jgi:hypothetical protein
MDQEALGILLSVYRIALYDKTEKQRIRELENLIAEFEAELTEALLQDQQEIELIKNERDFYFNKLRTIEKVQI